MSRAGIEMKTAGIIVIVVIVIAALAAFVLIPSPSNSTSTSTSTTSATGTQVGGLHITNMFGDVNVAGDQAPTTNTSTVADKTTYTGDAGQQFTVNFDIIWSLCAGTCPSSIQGVVALTSGFTVVSTVPTMPVPVVGTTGVQMECHFVVTVQPPSTPYNGTLTLVAAA